MQINIRMRNESHVNRLLEKFQRERERQRARQNENEQIYDLCESIFPVNVLNVMSK